MSPAPYHSTMKIVLNGENESLSQPCTVHELLAARKLADRPAAVEVNGNIVPKAIHEEYILNDGDRVEIVTLVGGG